MALHSSTYNAASTNATSASAGSGGASGASAVSTTTSSDQNFDYMFKLLIIGSF